MEAKKTEESELILNAKQPDKLGIPIKSKKRQEPEDYGSSSSQTTDEEQIAESTKHKGGHGSTKNAFKGSSINFKSTKRS